MSGDAPTLDIRALVARIDRDQEEARKFAAEQRKLMAEADKFNAEQRKLGREWYLAPFLAGAAVLASGAGFMAILLRLFGRG